MFEAIYASAEAGGAKPPWDYGAARPQLVEWAEARNLAGGGREALVVGCGYGADAEFLSVLGSAPWSGGLRGLILGAYSPLLIAAMTAVSLAGLRSAMEPSER